MAADVAAGVALLFERSAELEIDRQRIALMGHSSGAHLAALVAGDPALLGAHGLAPTDLAGVIANDGAAFDAREPSTGSRLLAKRLIHPAIPPAEAATLSPAIRIAPEGHYPPFLILHAARREARKQGGKLERALQRAGTRVDRHRFSGAGALAHVRLSRQFGRAGFGPTEVARRWLRGVFAG
jgi:arylformamidase